MHNENISEAYPEEQLNTQDNFWYSIIENCEASIAELKEEICRRRMNINNLEAGMNGYLTYHMNKLFNKNPGADILELYKVDGIKIYKPCDCSMTSLKIPDLNSISVFTMENNDLSLMKFIKELAQQEKELMLNIERLREKELALKEAHREVNAMISEASRQNRRAVSEDLLVGTNERLSCENQHLKEELNEVRNDIMEQMKDTQLVLIRTIEEQLEINEDLEQQLANFDGGDNSVQHKTKKLIDDLYAKVAAMNVKIQEQMDLNEELRYNIKHSMDKLSELKNSIIKGRLAELQCSC